AVLIGINVYPPSSNLQGCMNDVKEMVEFLVNDLGMSEGHIQCLLSTSSEERPMTCITVTSPTHKNIINTLLSLSTRCDILPGDNIIIYFAGHGSSYDLSGFYRAGSILAEGYIKAICPMDHNTPSGTSTSIPDIRDREINTILTEISCTKGCNITVILDCCYSTGNTRG
ncbi:peptidase C14, caspase domain-containing protein, partial [Armillaria nabsnona]